MSYILIQQFSSQHAHIKFNGHFHGEAVSWDTHFFTINDFIAKNKIKNSNNKQFIEIEPIDSKNMKLTVALKLNEITEPNIKKMMLMINQYKNLSLGRHEYG